VIVRPATAADAEVIVHLVETVDRARFDRTEAEWYATRERLRAVLDSGDSVVFVAERGDRLVGEMLGVPRGSGALGLGVAVLEDSRRQGVATMLFEAMAQWARGEGFDELELDVQEINEAARALYAKLGFADTGRRRSGERGIVRTLSLRLSQAPCT